MALQGAGVLGTLTLSAASDPVTFATFSQQTPHATAFTLLNNGQTGGNELITFGTTNTPVWLSIDSGTPTTAAGKGLAGKTIDAYLWMTSTSSTPAVLTGNVLIQPFGSLTTITIQSKTDFAANNTNYLLQATYTTGDMVGTKKGTANTEFNSSDVTYTSYYLNLAGAQNGALGLDFTGLTSKYTVSANGLVNGFRASGVGGFSASLAPEPETYALFGTCLLALAWKLRRNRRQLRS